MPLGKRPILSGAYWVSWVKSYAPTSEDIKDLEMSFRDKVKEFIQALQAAGAKVEVSHTYRSAQAAYLWHWAWKISQRKVAPKDAKPYALPGRPIPEIEWDHGNLTASIKGATEMVKGFGLSTPTSPNPSYLPPSLNTLHRGAKGGEAVDMTIKFSQDIAVKKKDGSQVTVKPGPILSNSALHEVGESYGVYKNLKDGPHWSKMKDGR
jgi:hypothetical protein